MTDLNIPDVVSCEVKNDKVKFSIDDMSTAWIERNDNFTGRIDTSRINPVLSAEHIKKEIQIKNILDDGISLLAGEKYPKAVRCFDEVLFYDEEYGDALIAKSYALKGQKHFVKSLRYYKKASKCGFKDIEYYKSLLKLANSERDNFPKLKRNIYLGDEFFTKGDYEKALESYNKALVNPSKFKDKILFKLLNKKATALVKLNDFEEALKSYQESLNVNKNDYAFYGEAYCQYRLYRTISDEFKSVLRTDKKHMLCQAEILNELGFLKESLAICDYLFDNHFKVDDFYRKLLKTRTGVMDKLKMDIGKSDKMLLNEVL